MSGQSRKTEKFNWLPNEFGLYQQLKLTNDSPAGDKFRSTVRYRLPRNWNAVTNTASDMKRVLFIVNSINNTWYHYHISRLLPDWLIVSLDLRYNGYDSAGLTGLNMEGSAANDSNTFVGNLRDCYDDIEFCYNYFNINDADTVLMYGYNIGALVALGFYNTYKRPNAVVTDKVFKVTHLILNSPYLTLPTTSGKLLSATVFNPLSYIFPTATQTGVMDKLYDSSATVLCTTIPPAIFLATGGGVGFAVSAAATVVAKNLLNTASAAIPHTSLKTLHLNNNGAVDTVAYVQSQYKNFYLDAGTVSSVTGSRTLAFGRSITDIQSQIQKTGAFITCPTIALFSATMVTNAEIVNFVGDSESGATTADSCIAILKKMCTTAPLTYKFPEVYNDALLSNDMFTMSKSVYSLFVWLQNNGVELHNDDGSVWDMAAATVSSISARMETYIANENLVTGKLIEEGSNFAAAKPMQKSHPLTVVRSMYRATWDRNTPL
jgi:hypothetical protein